MKIISSKNTWYFIFGILFIVIITIIAFNTIFKRTENKLKDTSSKERKTLITQKETKPSGLTYTKASPTPSPEASKKPFFTLFDTIAKPSASPSPSLTDIKNKEIITSIVTINSKNSTGKKPTSSTTKSSDLKMINEDGIVYLSTQNKDDSEDTLVKKNKKNILEIINPPPGYAQDIGEFINKLVRLSLAFASLMVFVQLILGGLQWLTSGGDKGKIEEARNKITAAVVGLIIVASSYAVFTLILKSLGIGDINSLLKSVLS